MDIDNWTSQVRKGLLDLCVMNLLARRDMYGYDLVKRLAEIKGIVITEGTIYPLLSRLRRSGLVETRLEASPSGPARRYYGLTAKGIKTVGTMNAYWDELELGVKRLRRTKQNKEDKR